MKLSAFSILDAKAQSFMQPFYFNYKGQASRTLEDILKEKDHPIAKHPEDYSLYLLGTFDPFTGRLEPLEVPELVCRATDFQPIGA